MLHYSGMPYHDILFEADDAGIALVTVNRPDKRNALSRGVVAELKDALERVAGDASLRGAILTGAGSKAFVAGADIGELAAMNPLETRDYAISGQNVFRMLETARKPWVAAVNGYALGGGLELAMSCAVRFASENAELGQPEVKLGLTPGFGGTQRLPRLVGRGRALQMLLSGEAVGAAEAYRIGLVNAVVPQADLIAFSRAWLAKVAANAPVAVAMTMQAVDTGLETDLETGLRFEAAAFGLCAATGDCKEGTRAFLEKRRAVFTGH